MNEVVTNKMARDIYDVWRVNFSTMKCFDLARRLISLADAEMIEDLKMQNAQFNVVKIKRGHEVMEPEPCGVVEDEWGIL